MPRKPKVSTELVVREKLSRSAKEPKSEDTSVSESVAKAPKKVKKAVKATKPDGKKKAKSHPTYQKMIKNAMKADSGRKGTSIFAIYNFLEANHSVPSTFKLYARNAVKKMVEDGLLIKVTPLRYKLSKNERAKLTKKKAKKTKKTKKDDKKEKKEKKSTKTKSKSKTDKKEKKSPAKKTEKTKKTKESKRTTKAKAGKESPVSSPAKSTRATKASTTSARGTAKPKKGSTEAKASESTGELVWVWQYYDNGFHNYDPEASGVVEGVYQEYKTSPYTTDVRSVKSGQWNYLVDFREMTQQNVQHENHTKRKIRRVQIPASETGDRSKNYGKGDS